MRPPEFTGGNAKDRHRHTGVISEASMRPPEFTGGNSRVDIENRVRHFLLQ